MKAKTFTMELPGTQYASFQQAVVDSACQITAATVRTLPLMTSGQASEMGGESHITAPDGQRFTVSVWLRDASKADVPLGERVTAGNG